MKKKVFGRKLSRGRSARKALFSSLIKALVSNGKIVTTKAKAKAVRGDVEKYLNLARKGTLNARRTVLGELNNNSQITKTLFDKKFKSFRIVNLPSRKGDNAKMVRMELAEEIVEKKETKDENVPAKRKRS
jgi:large subunit ribosomal protein L17